jgi:hypothetical protein
MAQFHMIHQRLDVGKHQPMFTCEPLPVASRRNLRIPIVMVNETSGSPDRSGMVIDGLLRGV